MCEVTKAKEKYDGKLNLICGIELGEPCQRLENTEFFVNDERLDFIIASNHQIRGHRDFYFLDYKVYDIHTLLTTYYDEIYEICKWNKFDVLGHLTYTLRYMTGVQGHIVNMESYNEIIRECFKVLSQNGKGIEINTSGLRQQYGFTFPTLDYVKMFKECGGEVLSIGSDSHCAADLGKGIVEGRITSYNVCYTKLLRFGFGARS